MVPLGEAAMVIAVGSELLTNTVAPVGLCNALSHEDVFGAMEFALAIVNVTVDELTTAHTNRRWLTAVFCA